MDRNQSPNEEIWPDMPLFQRALSDVESHANSSPPPQPFPPRGGSRKGLVRGIGLILVVAVSACGKAGPKIAPVSGTVLLDGTPLTEGVVCFASKSGYVSSAAVAPDGRFQLTSQYGPGIPLGDYRVTVLPKSPDISEMSMQSKAKLPPSRIPIRYQYPDRSGLTATVQEGPADFIFRLTTAK